MGLEICRSGSARERLLGSGDEQTIRNRHLDYFLELVEEMAPGFMSAGQLSLFRQADAEMDNIRTAFEWAVNSRQIEKAARLIAAVRETGEVMREEMNKHNLCLVAYMDGDYVRAYDLLMPVIRKKDLSQQKHAVVGAFAVLSVILTHLGDPEKGARILGACHRLNSELGIGYLAFEISLINQGTADTRALMGEAAFAEAWAEGQCMTYEQLLDYVLEEEGKLETKN